MRHSFVFTIACAPLLVLLLQAPASAGWPSEARLTRDVTKHWKKTWPDQELTHVTGKTGCEKAKLEDAAYKKRTGKSRMLKACLVKADAFVAKGYRFFIYRDSYVYYVAHKLRSVQLGELEKAWKAGGVPAPGPDEAARLLRESAEKDLGASDVQITIHEMGRPRPYGDFYRLTLIADIAYKKDGKQNKKEKVLSTLQSDGTEWKPAPGLAL